MGLQQITGALEKGKRSIDNIKYKNITYIHVSLEKIKTLETKIPQEADLNKDIFYDRTTLTTAPGNVNDNLISLYSCVRRKFSVRKR